MNLRKTNKINLFNTNFILFLNIIFSPLVIILLVLIKEYELSSYFGLVTASAIFITQSLSANKRQLIIFKPEKKIIDASILFRFIFSIIIIVFINSIIYFYNKAFFYNLFFLVPLLCVFWILEIIVTKNEINREFKNNFFLTISYIIFYLLLIYIFFSGNIYNYFSILLICFIILLSIYIVFSLNLNFIKSFYIIKKKNIIKNFDKSFLSSFSQIFCNFLWRIGIYFFVGAEKAGIFYAAFSIGSLPATIFVNTFGPYFLKMKNSFLKLLKISFIFYLPIIVFFIVVFSFDEKFFLNIIVNELFLEIAAISILGSFFMLYGQYKRKEILLSNISKKNTVFITDFYYSIILCTVVPITFFIGQIDLLKYSFLVGALINSLFYYNLSLKIKNYV